MIDYGWLKSLKPGDPVVVCHSHFTHTSYELRKVERLTPTGIIVVDGLHYRPNDGSRKGESAVGIYVRLLNYNDESVKTRLLEYEHRRYVTRIRNRISDEPLSYVEAKVIAKALGWDGEQPDRPITKIDDLLMDINPVEITAQTTAGHLDQWCETIRKEIRKRLEADQK